MSWDKWAQKTPVVMSGVKLWPTDLDRNANLFEL